MSERATRAPATTPVPPTTVGPFTVLAHVLFGVVGLLAVGVGAAWWWAGDALLGERDRPALLTGAPAGSIGVGGDLEPETLGLVCGALMLSLEVAGGSAPALAPIRFDAVPTTGARTTVRAAVLAPVNAPVNAPQPIEVRAVLEEFALQLVELDARAADASKWIAGGAVAFAPPGGIHGIHSAVPARIALGDEELESLFVQYRPLDGGAVREWRAELVGEGVRFVAR